MNKIVYRIISATALLALTFGSYTSAGATPQHPIPVLPAKTINSPQTYDCGGGQTSDINIINTHDVIIRNCDIVGKIYLVDSSNVTISNVSITNAGYQNAAISISATTNGATHDITVEDFYIHGNNVCWGFSGSEAPISNIIIRRGTIEDIGQDEGIQCHGMYIENWQAFLIEDVNILRSWNYGIKIISNVNNGTIRRVTIKDSGRSGTGGGIVFGEPSRASVIDNISLEFCDIQNSKQPAVYVLSQVTALKIDHCFFKNNYHAVMVASGSTGWTVTNNVGYNEASYPGSNAAIYVENDAAIANNFFDYNNWYYDGRNPAKIGSSTLSFAQWQSKGADLHGVSLYDQSVSPALNIKTYADTSRWTNSFDLSHSWTVKDFVRTVGDVNKDGKDDVVGFGLDGVYVSLSTGSGFGPISRWTTSFDLSHGWTVKDFVRTVGDVNKDGRADLVGFGLDGVYVALSTGTGFGPISRWTTAFDLSHGWTVAQYVRTVGDVNNDGRADLVGFGLDGVYVALSTGTGFGPITRWTTAFAGWTVAQYERRVGDVNNDGRADLVGFGQNGVYVALSTGTGFGSMSRWTTAFSGWTVKDYVRTVGDVNGDGNADLIGYGLGGIYTAISNGSGFDTTNLSTTDFNYFSQGWRVDQHYRTVGDVNGDGKDDAVGFGLDGVYVGVAK